MDSHGNRKSFLIVVGLFGFSRKSFFPANIHRYGKVIQCFICPGYINETVCVNFMRKFYADILDPLGALTQFIVGFAEGFVKNST